MWKICSLEEIIEIVILHFHLEKYCLTQYTSSFRKWKYILNLYTMQTVYLIKHVYAIICFKYVQLQMISFDLWKIST